VVGIIGDMCSCGTCVGLPLYHTLHAPPLPPNSYPLLPVRPEVATVGGEQTSLFTAALHLQPRDGDETWRRAGQRRRAKLFCRAHILPSTPPACIFSLRTGGTWRARPLAHARRRNDWANCLRGPPPPPHRHVSRQCGNRWRGSMRRRHCVYGLHTARALRTPPPAASTALTNPERLLPYRYAPPRAKHLLADTAERPAPHTLPHPLHTFCPQSMASPACRPLYSPPLPHLHTL